MITPRPPMPFIVGAPRSGTTLLRFMLDSHPEVAIPPETGFLALAPEIADTGHGLRTAFVDAIVGFPAGAPLWQDFHLPEGQFRAAIEALEPFTIADGYRTFYALYAARFGKARSGDKTPTYCHQLQVIESVLSEASFIHVIRDGRDAALSLRPLWFSPGSDVETLARHWQAFVSTGREQGARCRRYLEIRYEALVQHPEESLRQICAFLDLPYAGAMLRYYERTPARLKEHLARSLSNGTEIVSHAQRMRQQEKTMEPPDPERVFAWKSAMSHEERREFDAAAGDLLEELGYER